MIETPKPEWEFFCEDRHTRTDVLRVGDKVILRVLLTRLGIADDPRGVTMIGPFDAGLLKENNPNGDK